MNDRENDILSMLSAQRETTVKEIAKALYVSESTIRRDLAMLAADDKIIRTFRGAKKRDYTNSEKVSFLYRAQQNTAAKEKIARLCLPYIHDGDLLMFDDSSTVMFLVPLLTRFKNLSVVTNCIRTAYALCELGIGNYLTGGYAHFCKSFAYTGPYAEGMLRDFHGDLALFSCKGVSMQGQISSGSDMQDVLRQTMIANCRTSLLLCDSTKIGKIYAHDYANVRDVDAVLCDTPLPESLRAQVGARKRERNATRADEFKVRRH